MRNTDAIDLIEALQRSGQALPRAILERRWSEPALRAAVLSGNVHRLLPGLYVATEHADSLFSRAHAATAWVGPRSVLIGTGAAAVWELCDAPTGRIRVSAPYGAHRTCPEWLRISRLPKPPPSADWRECAVATPAWAALTAYCEAPRSSRDTLIYRVVQQGLATSSELAATAEALARIPGRSHLLTVISAAAAGAESHLEKVGLRSVFATREFSGFLRQHRLRTDGVTYRLDMFEPGTRTAVELDGAEAHHLPSQRLRDIERDARLAAAGVLTIRFAFGDITSRGAWCRDIVRRTLATRSHRTHA